ncbi:uncharacterized protein LOC130633281 isoform X1 [Hydractinia symbiolongicarpus]|uniref:uncharacterized protein LOC130633281 isoform X1 n=1 Tax=Hydractinia symbiolongicarpus TaxID=13093 RepID=UPI00254B941C|nr:uncharacterized protein LOC130633281 isoform X1 [Hydractinia symbiolongicarpus]
MNYIYLFAVFILVIYRVEGETRLNPRGNNVCKLVTSYTALASTKTSYSIKTPYKTCCKRIVFCVKRCTKFRNKKIYYKKTRITAKLNTTYRCCKGYERTHPSHTQCLKPICIKGCDVGSCVAPNICQMTYDSRLGFKESVKLPERCGGHFEKASGKIALHGNTTHPIYRTRLCRWTIRIQNVSTHLIVKINLFLGPEFGPSRQFKIIGKNVMDLKSHLNPKKRTVFNHSTITLTFLYTGFPIFFQIKTVGEFSLVLKKQALHEGW